MAEPTLFDPPAAVNDSTRHGHRFKDLTGRQFGKLTVIRFAGRGDHGRSMWLCRCSCEAATETVVAANNLKSGTSTSCGCSRKGRTGQTNPCFRHGGIHSPEYRCWYGMIRRCRDDNDPNWHHYGGRGIKVCDQWQGKKGFANFLADMGPRPSPKHSIDRLNVNGNYEPDNCAWRTWKEQERNRRNNRTLTHRGETLCVSEWAERLGIKPATLYKRLEYGWSVERTLETNTLSLAEQTNRRSRDTHGRFEGGSSRPASNRR